MDRPGRIRRNPIHIEKTTDWRGRSVWVWSCDDHIRCRGVHGRSRRLDRWLARMGKPPDVHPLLRAMDGAESDNPDLELAEALVRAIRGACSIHSQKLTGIVGRLLPEAIY